MVVLLETDARFPALCRGNWGPVSRKMVDGCGVPSSFSMGSTSWTREGKGNKIGCRSLLLPCSLITGWNCGCFWFLGFFLREGWWTKNGVKNFCSGKQFLMQVQSHVRLHPQIFCGYTTCCDAWGPGRRLTGASLLNIYDVYNINKYIIYIYVWMSPTTNLRHGNQYPSLPIAASPRICTCFWSPVGLNASDFCWKPWPFQVPYKHGSRRHWSSKPIYQSTGHWSSWRRAFFLEKLKVLGNNSILPTTESFHSVHLFKDSLFWVMNGAKRVETIQRTGFFYEIVGNMKWWPK